MMHMTFYWGKNVTILFDSWKTDSWPTYFLSLLACFLFSAFYQCVEDRRRRLSDSRDPTPLRAQLLLSKAGGRWAPSRYAGAVLFGISSAIGYLLMLAIMSFNGGVFVAVVVGLGFGYLLFRDGNEGLAAAAADGPCACA